MRQMGVRAGPDWLRRNPIASGWADNSPKGLRIIDKPRSKPKRFFARAERRAGQTLTAWRSLVTELARTPSVGVHRRVLDQYLLPDFGIWFS
jgi:hypothetical protein